MDFLREFKTEYDNPFLDKSFSLCGEETYGKGYSLHKINGVFRVFKDERLFVRFAKADLILGLAVVVQTISDPYSADDVVLKVNNLALNFSKGEVFAKKEVFQKVYELVRVLENEVIEVEINFSRKSKYFYSKQVLLYIINKYYEDSHFRDIEMARGEAGEDSIDF